MPKPLAVAGYRKLVTEIATLYEGARKALVTAYWEIGKRIVEVEQEGEIKAAYGTGLLQKLSQDLTKQCGQGFSVSNLRRMRQFYASHSKQPPAVELKWTQYAELLPIESAVKREQLIQKAIREELDSKALRRIVQSELVREEVANNLVRSKAYGVTSSDASAVPRTPSGLPELLTPARGTLYAYRIIQPKLVGVGNSELLIDLGFSAYKDLDDITGKSFAPDTIIQSTKNAQGEYSLAVSRSPLPAALYTYKAEVERIVDGDTLRVVVDLGFGFKTRQYLRLRGLDCPESDTPEGKKAAEFVRSRIKQTDQIMLMSSRSDKYDRYLADVFYADSEGNEQYLNNLLLEQGLAVKVQS